VNWREGEVRLPGWDDPALALVPIPPRWLPWLTRFAGSAQISEGELVLVALTTLARRWKFEEPPGGTGSLQRWPVDNEVAGLTMLCPKCGGDGALDPVDESGPSEFIVCDLCDGRGRTSPGKAMEWREQQARRC